MICSAAQGIDRISCLTLASSSPDLVIRKNPRRWSFEECTFGLMLTLLPLFTKWAKPKFKVGEATRKHVDHIAHNSSFSRMRNSVFVSLCFYAPASLFSRFALLSVHVSILLYYHISMAPPAKRVRTIESFFNQDAATAPGTSNYSEPVIIPATLQPLCIFAEAGRPGKGGLAPTNSANKIAWDNLSTYSVTFLDVSSQRFLRVHVNKEKEICVQDIVKFQHDNDSKIRLKDAWLSFDDAKKMCSCISGLDLLFESKRRIAEDELPRMLN